MGLKEGFPTAEGGRSGSRAETFRTKTVVVSTK